ncbi:hypothetical protein GCM10009544_17110 [Streptomyces stramineus]|uniref:Tn3 transposase DDE domain-containing protein n=1 Tax=Streptomyces stramineus TaxID=173861 RepID=A0ABN0ZR48_9ACTN
MWNTRYLDAAVARLRAEGHGVKDEDVARLSPLKDRHVNFRGRYLFNIEASGPGQWPVALPRPRRHRGQRGRRLIADAPPVSSS